MRERDLSARELSLLEQAGWMRRVARRLVADEAAADDVVQEAFAVALSSSGEVPDAERPRAFFTGLVRNVARMQARAAARREAREKVVARDEQLPGASELVERAELLQQLGRAVLSLREPYRTTLLLRYFEELSAEEIARRLDLPSSTVRNRLRRGLDELRAKLDAEHGERRAWALALVPLSVPALPPMAPVPHSITVASAAGGVPMIAKLGIALTAALGAGTWSFVAGGAHTSNELRSTSVLATSDEEVQGERTESSEGADQQGERRPVERAPQPAPQLLAGRVLDEKGVPIVCAKVFIGGQPSPFDELPTAGVWVSSGDELRAEELNAAQREPRDWIREGAALGKLVETDVDGRFSLRFAKASRAFVCLAARPGLRRDASDCGWRETPAAELVLRARRVPTATLTIKLLDETSGTPIAPFHGRLGRADGERLELCGGAEGSWHIVELDDGAPATWRVEVTMPPWAATTREVVLRPGAAEVLELRARSGAGFTGRVTDAAGAPLAGAVVFWGGVERLRTRGHFGAFARECVIDRVSTDATGVFHLPGWSDTVTAWHTDHSALTKPATDATLLALPAAGAIEGVLRNDTAAPLAGVTVVLDSERETLTDERGRFVFERVPAGAHGIDIERGGWLGARLEPGERLELPELRRLGAVRLALQPAGTAWPEELGGLYIGVERVFGMGEWGARDGSVALRAPFPGRTLFVSMQGHIAWVDLSGPEGTLDFGSADLTLRAPPGAHVWIAPACSSEVALSQVRRITREVPASGELRFAPLPVGIYELGVKDASARTIVAAVSGPGAQAVLD